MASAVRTLVLRHGSKRAVETRNCASAGLRRTKSSVPLRMCSTTAVRLGLMAPSSTPWSNVNQPMTISASPKLQPAMTGRSWKTTTSGTSAVAVQQKEMPPSRRKSARYCSPSSSELRTWTRTGAGSAAANALSLRRPRSAADHAARATTVRRRSPATNAHCLASRASAPATRVGAGHELDREADLVAEGQPATTSARSARGRGRPG